MAGTTRTVKSSAVKKKSVSGSVTVKSAYQIQYTDEDKRVKKARVLMVGKSGSGKTMLAGGFDKPFFINSDDGLATLKDIHVPFVDLDREDRRLMKTVYGIITEIEEGVIDCETIVFDGLTSFSEMLEQNVKLFPPDRKDPMESLRIQDYNTIQGRLVSLINALKRTGKHVVFTANSEFATDEMDVKLEEQPSVTGRKLGPKLAQYFDEVYYLEYDAKKNKYVVHLKPTFYFPYAKSRHKGDGVIENCTYDDLKHLH